MLRELNIQEMEMVSGGQWVGLDHVDANVTGTSLVDDGFGTHINGVESYLSVEENSLWMVMAASMGTLANIESPNCEQALADAATDVGATAAVLGGLAVALAAIPHPAAQGASRVLGAAAGVMGGGAGAAVLHGCHGQNQAPGISVPSVP